MRRTSVALALAGLCLLLAGCATLGADMSYIQPGDVAGEPTVYAEVLNAPNPLFLGLWRRPKPEGLSKPWVFTYWLVRKGDRLAVYYCYDSRNKNDFKGWAPFVIDGDTMTSSVDSVVFSVKDGQMFMQYPGRNVSYPMQKVR